MRAHKKQFLMSSYQLTPSNGVTIQYRSSTGGNSANNNTTGFSTPY